MTAPRGLIPDSQREKNGPSSLMKIQPAFWKTYSDLIQDLSTLSSRKMAQLPLQQRLT
jgi:hypothetical protein